MKNWGWRPENQTLSQTEELPLLRLVSQEGASAANGPMPAYLVEGQLFEQQVLAAQNVAKNANVWRPTSAQIDSALFKVVVGDRGRIRLLHTGVHGPHQPLPDEFSRDAFQPFTDLAPD